MALQHSHLAALIEYHVGVQIHQDNRLSILLRTMPPVAPEALQRVDPLLHPQSTLPFELPSEPNVGTRHRAPCNRIPPPD